MENIAILDKIEEMTEALKTLSTQVDKLKKEKTSRQDIEKLVKMTIDKSAYYDPPSLNQSLIDTLPEKFNINELSKFHVTDDPKNFLK